ncbi:hypothetical protein AMTR_s00078p00165260 [Amborella trichopoda]|uniref:Glucan endo-1,3-beta-D-glucosidase n=1 Tax=Amborella trichopoda TaxID=13333 RepID=W1P201_AMBTC|nr:hypothetical protein AMTR_s00078p00165260 [Amborella trichopoda]
MYTLTAIVIELPEIAATIASATRLLCAKSHGSGRVPGRDLHYDIVVQMLKDNGVKKVKLFDGDAWTLRSLVGGGIKVTVAISK